MSIDAPHTSSFDRQVLLWPEIPGTTYATNRSFGLELVQESTGSKQVTLRVNALKTYARSAPKPARRQMAYFTESFNRIRYVYARYGMQPMYLLIKLPSTCRSGVS